MDTPKLPYQRIVLLTEDNAEQLLALKNSADLYFSNEPTAKVIIASSTSEAISGLESCLSQSPQASLYAVLDFNMGHNPQGNRRPT